MTARPQKGDPLYLVGVAWRRRWLLLAVILLIPAAVYGVSSRVEKTYMATTTLQVRATSISSPLLPSQPVVSTSAASGAARRIKTTAVAKLAARELGESPSVAASLLGSITVAAEAEGEDTSTEFLSITARAERPKRAADIANAFARAIGATRTKETVKTINKTIRALTAQRAERRRERDPAARKALEEQLSALRALRATQEAGATEVVEPATPPGAPVSPQPYRNTTLAAVVAVLLAAGLVGLFERLDRRLRDPEELEELISAPLLGMVPEIGFDPELSRSSDHSHEAFQTLRASLTSFNIDRALTSVIVASPGHADGKSSVATNLALAVAQDGKDVVLIDGDLRKPQVATRLDVADSDLPLSLDTVLVEGEGLEAALVDIEVDGGRLRILPASGSSTNPSVLLGSERMRSLLGWLSERADFVVIDTPAMLVVSDAIPLLDQASGVVLVARINHTSKDALVRARQVIDAAGGTVLGVVATGTQIGGLYGYGRYESY